MRPRFLPRGFRAGSFLSFSMSLFRHTFLPLLCLAAASPPARAQTAAPPATGPATQLSAVTVTGTREKALLAETPVSVGAIAAESIRDTAPLHPGQLLGQVPGVAVAVTNGEGHTTAIRQPFTTSPVYLFLEDGIPIRATGFFNHNALYEVNLPLAGGVEVIRGPGTALYGSDAIGGIVNILSRAPTGAPRYSLSGEAGSFGTWRFLGSGGGAFSEQAGVQVDLNATHTAGWRDRTAYDRQSANLRCDQRLGDRTMLKTIVGASKIDQQTGANSPLTFADYLNNPTRNNLPIAYRKVSAARLSVEYERQFDGSMLSVVPYFRDNAMELNGSYNLNSDPRLENTHNVSYGLLAKWRQNLPFLRARLIGGLDLDYSPGSRREDNLLVTRTGTGANTVFSAYTLGARIYDYRVTFQSASPYVHSEFSLTRALRFTAGVRYDALRYKMSNNLPAGTVPASVLGATRFYGQLAADRAEFSRVSPKLGATYALTPHTHAYASYNFGFRAPSEGQLYRAGNDTTAANALARSQLALGLRPIQATQLELGLRGELGVWSYNLAAYDLGKKHDLVSQRDLATNVTTNVNAGKTDHRGVELGLGARLAEGLRFDTAFSCARHRYVDWVTATASFSGRTIESAPRILVNTRLTWHPVSDSMLQIEWVRIGAYWLEAGNSSAFGRYPGHDLLNLRGSYALTKNLSLFARVMNATDKRFADSASVTSNTPVFSPGLPRAFYAGLETHW
jgi:outer membrane receptor protein involved in Fe transport